MKINFQKVILQLIVVLSGQQRRFLALPNDQIDSLDILQMGTSFLDGYLQTTDMGDLCYKGCNK